MLRLELSIDGDNAASAIRDAVIGAEPDQCHGCDYALAHSYEIGQFARINELSPEKAAEVAWGYLGACCKSEIGVELLTPDDEPSVSEEKVLVSV